MRWHVSGLDNAGDQVPSDKLSSSIPAALATGWVLAASWFAGTSLLFSGFRDTIIPAVGAVAIAGVIPVLMIKRKLDGNVDQSQSFLSQRLNAFDKHACISIIDDQEELTEVNDHLLNLTGYAREELIGQKVRVFYNPSRQKVADEVRSYQLRGETWQGETQLRRKDGSTLFTQSTVMPFMDGQGKYAGSITIRTDVTQTNKLIAQQETAETLNELRDDIWIIDAETEKFSYLNRAAKDRLSINEADYLSKDLDDFLATSELDEVLQACRGLRENGEVSTQFETSLKGVAMHVSIKFLPDAQKAGRYLVLLNDISDRLEQEQRKSAFVSTVSHELRSPLTSIKGAMGLLLSGSAGDLPDKALTLLDIAHRNADRLILIINDILDLDKMSNGQMIFDLKEVDLVELVKETDKASAMLQQRFGVDVILRGAEEPILFQTDPNRFIQVLTNLTSNAYKFAPPQSSIVIGIENGADYVRVSVQDEGPGISLDEQHKIFDRFADMSNSERTTKGGTGLGLNICRAIVESLGGTIGFDTEEGVGTTFYFSLPKSVPNSVVFDEISSRQIA